jgi:hypothetical protein
MALATVIAVALLLPKFLVRLTHSLVVMLPCNLLTLGTAIA